MASSSENPNSEMLANVDPEKHEAAELWSSSVSSSSNGEIQGGGGYKARTPKETAAIHAALAKKHGVRQRRLQWKIDLWIVLPICLLYLLAFLDRVNISNANAYGMSEDLHLEGNQFNVALAVFFVPYIVFEIPANWLLKKMSPHIFLPICLVGFGAVSIGQGFVRNYHSLIVTRVLLGLMETAMFPACFYLLGTWFTRDEAQKRYSFFFASTSLAGAFGGLIAYGMKTLHMKEGLESWRWLFIVEGSITGACGLLLFFLIADFPEQARFLKDNERAYIREKLSVDQGESNFEQKTRVKDMLAVFKDWKVFVVAFMYFGQLVGAYGYAYFSTAIIKTFGNSPIDTQVYSIYPWILSFGGSMIFATFSDFFRHRYLFTLFGGVLGIIGYGILLGTSPAIENRHARYAACFLVCLGMYGTMPLIVCWANMNFSGHTRKMVASAFQVGFGNIGGIISTFIYRQQDAPGYSRGLWVSLALLLFSMASCLTYFLGLIKTNTDREKGKRDLWWSQMSEEKRNKAGDMNPAFRYMY